MTVTEAISISVARPRPERRLGLSVRGWTLALALLVILFLELAPRLGLVPRYILPPLSEVAVNLAKLFGEPTFWQETILPSIFAILLAFGMATVAGIVIGLITWQWRPLRVALEPWLTVYYAIPLYALYPILVVMFGLGLVPVVGIGFSLAVVSVITATLDGLDSVPAVTLRLAQALRLSPWQRATKVLLPASLQQIGVGLRLAMSFSIIGVLASEFILSTYGIGHFISYSFDQFATLDMYAGILFVVLIAAAVNWGGGVILARWNSKVSG